MTQVYRASLEIGVSLSFQEATLPAQPVDPGLLTLYQTVQPGSISTSGFPVPPSVSVPLLCVTGCFLSTGAQFYSFVT